MEEDLTETTQQRLSASMKSEAITVWILSKLTRMMPVRWSTYAFSVSIRSFRGLDFFGFPSEEAYEGLVGVSGAGVKGTTRPGEPGIQNMYDQGLERADLGREKPTVAKSQSADNFGDNPGPLVVVAAAAERWNLLDLQEVTVEVSRP